MKLGEQEKFWKGKFGDKYLKRNVIQNRHLVIGKDLLDNKISISSAVELGPNIGLNLDGLKRVYPELKLLELRLIRKHSIY